GRTDGGRGRRPLDDAVLAHGRLGTHGPGITYRRAGDRFLLIELGEMVLDLELRLGVEALVRWLGAHVPHGVIDVTAGVRSLLVQVDGTTLTVGRLLSAVRTAEHELDDVLAEPFPSRVV